MVFVRERGRAMAEAAAREPTGMTAVLGGRPRTRCWPPSTPTGSPPPTSTAPARSSRPGPLEALGRLRRRPSRRAPGCARCRSPAPSTPPTWRPPSTSWPALPARSPPTTPASGCCPTPTATVVQDGRDVLRRLVAQVSHPVRWDRCMQTRWATSASPRRSRCPPAGTLAGLAKRALPGVEVVALKTPDDLAAARSLVERHGTPARCRPAPSWRMVVAPGKGTFQRPRPPRSEAPRRRAPPSAPCHPARRAAGRRSPRRHGRRVARRGRRPGLAGPAAGSAPPSPARRHDRHHPGLHRGARYARILGVGAYRPAARGHQRRDLRAHRLLRRVDP